MASTRPNYASPLFVQRVLVVFSLFSNDVASFCFSPATGYPPRLPQDAVENAVSRESAVSHARAPSEITQIDRDICTFGRKIVDVTLFDHVISF